MAFAENRGIFLPLNLVQSTRSAAVSDRGHACSGVNAPRSKKQNTHARTHKTRVDVRRLTAGRIPTRSRKTDPSQHTWLEPRAREGAKIHDGGVVRGEPGIGGWRRVVEAATTNYK